MRITGLLTDCGRVEPLQIAQSQKLGTAIKAYVLNGGDFPLLDRVSYGRQFHLNEWEPQPF